jgi:hypothetical protein
MAMDPISLPSFPNVPFAQGVPPTNKPVNMFAEPTPTMPVITDTVAAISSFTRNTWGVFDEFGASVAAADSVLSVDYRGEARAADYPLEEGAFESYNKVQMPYDIRVKFAVGTAINDEGRALGSLSRRRDFLIGIENAKQSLELFDVVTPDATYRSVNIIHYDYRREASSGVSLLQVDVWMQEIRANVQPELASSTVDQGTVQSQQWEGVGQSSEWRTTGTETGWTIG